MYLLYNILWTIFSIFFFPAFIIYTIITGKKRKGILHFFGIFKKTDIYKIPYKKKIWIHALSIGEVNAVAPVLREIKNIGKKDISIILSTTTEGGYLTAKRLSPFVDLLTYSPFDYFLCVRTAFHRIQPDIIVITETGFWPNLIYYAKRLNAKSILIHGRISNRSFKKYKIIKRFVSKFLNELDLICMQNEYGAGQLEELGINRNKVKVLGDTKFDNLEDVSEEMKKNYRKIFLITSDTFVIIAGSTHEGEEEALIDIYLKLKENCNLLLIIAPRRLERIKEIEDILNSRSLKFEKVTQMKHGYRKEGIILLDTMGELARIYSIGDIVFVGKSLFHPGGGHSIIEPAAFGKVVFHGPYMEYNKQIADRMNKEGVAIEVKDKEDLLKKIELFLHDKILREDVQQKARRFIKKNQGAAKRLADLLV